MLKRTGFSLGEIMGMEVQDSRWYVQQYTDEKMSDEILFLSVHRIDVTNPTQCPSPRWRDWQGRKRAEETNNAQLVFEEPDAAVMDIITKTIQGNLKRNGRSSTST